jgi:hypothetical protein
VLQYPYPLSDLSIAFFTYSDKNIAAEKILF